MKSHCLCNSADVSIVTDLDAAYGLELEWDELLDASDCKDVTYSFRWYANWLRSFAGKGFARIVTAREGGRLTSILPLIEGEFQFRNCRVKALRSLTNLHSARYDMISAPGCERNLGDCLDKAFEKSGADLIVLNLVPEGSSIIRNLAGTCNGRRKRFLIRTQYENRLVVKQNSFPLFYGSLSSKFRKNVNAAERKATARGELRLLSPENEEMLENILERGFNIEASGWKGEQGSAIAQAPQTRSFYENIARDFLKTGWLYLYLLENGGKDIAFYFCVGNYGVIRALKIGISREHSGIGPGMLITKKVLEDLHKCEKINTWDFCGGSARWKRDWSNTSEKYHSVYIFRNSLAGKILHAGARFCSRLKRDHFTGDGSGAND